MKACFFVIVVLLWFPIYGPVHPNHSAAPYSGSTGPTALFSSSWLSRFDIHVSDTASRPTASALKMCLGCICTHPHCFSSISILSLPEIHSSVIIKLAARVLSFLPRGGYVFDVEVVNLPKLASTP